MPSPKRLLAISGSTRAASSNAALLRIIADLSTGRWELDLYDGLAGLPQFNPDADSNGAPAPVETLRRKIGGADGVLFCSPEYAMGVPGALKNALDWTVSTTVFTGKPVALITAASSGRRAHASMLGTLLVLGALLTEDTALLISFVQSKVSKAGELLDAGTRSELERLIAGFERLLEAGDGDASLRYLRSEGV